MERPENEQWPKKKASLSWQDILAEQDSPARKGCIKLPGLVLGHPFSTLTRSAKGHVLRVLPKRKWGAEAGRLLGFPFLSLFLAPLN